MADENISFKFDLDAKEALKALSEIKESIEKVGESKSVDSLIGSFTTLAGPIFIAGAALLAVKEALDLTLEGEAIERINKQFDILAQQAGLSSQVMREGLEKSLNGMVDMEDALKSSSEAIVKLGKNAQRIPELFELARKTSMVFGGDVVSNFDAMSQAIAAGNMRMLKHMGIIIDADKSYREYAKSIGVAASTLSETQKQTALMNSVLEYGSKKLGSIKGDSESVTAQFQKLKIAFKELGDGLAEFVNKTGIVKSAMSAMGAVAGSIGGLLRENFGDPLEKTDATIKRLNGELKEMQGALENAKKGNESWLNKIFGGPDTEMIQKRINDINARLAEANAERKKLEESRPKEEAAKAGPKVVDEEALRLQAAQRNKFEKELAAMTASRIKSQLESETDATNYQRLMSEERATIERQYQDKIQELQIKGREGKELTAKQAADMIAQIEQEKNSRLTIYDRQREEEAVKVFENQVKAAQTASAGIQAAFMKGGMEAQKNMKDFGKLGTTVFTAVQGGASKFFKGLGEGSKDAGTLMREFLFGSIADVAEAQGNFLLASGIGTMNPVQVAEGGALLVLAGFLRSQAGGGASTGGGAAGGASSGGGAGAPSSDLARPMAQETPKKTVTVQFLGDYLATSETQRRLVDLIRQETDATDYKYQQIPVR